MCTSERSERALKIYTFSLYSLPYYDQEYDQTLWGPPFCGGPWAAAHSALS